MQACQFPKAEGVGGVLAAGHLMPGHEHKDLQQQQQQQHSRRFHSKQLVWISHEWQMVQPGQCLKPSSISIAAHCLLLLPHLLLAVAGHGANLCNVQTWENCSSSSSSSSSGGGVCDTSKQPLT
jgi:hypothetical protein